MADIKKEHKVKVEKRGNRISLESIIDGKRVGTIASITKQNTEKMIKDKFNKRIK